MYDKGSLFADISSFIRLFLCAKILNTAYYVFLRLVWSVKFVIVQHFDSKSVNINSIRYISFNKIDN